VGASWRTSLVGYIAIASGVVGFIGDLLMTQGMPKTLPEYFLFGGLVLGGIGHILAKDSNVSNAPAPTVVAHDVPPTP
jgi:uncharacterized YccA/Bax inhibitor family protein